jgi:hypothetical protein
MRKIINCLKKYILFSPKALLIYFGLFLIINFIFCLLYLPMILIVLFGLGSIFFLKEIILI